MQNKTALGVLGPYETRRCRADLTEELDAVGGTIATIVSVAPTTASAALGLEVGTSSYAPAKALSDKAVDFYLSIDASNREDTTWNNGGQRCEVVITVEPNNTPTETIQVIYGIIVADGKA